MNSTLPLDGFRIADLTAIVSGPMATQLLSDQGADVVKIEPLPAGELTRRLGTQRGGTTSLYETINRGKRSLGLDLKSSAGRELFLRFVGTCDVVVENFRPGAMERLGLDYDSLRGVSSDLIYVQITGFGPDGPYSDQRVYDSIIQAVSGLAAIQGNPETGVPELVRNLVCDKITALTAAQAITGALLRRAQTGVGGKVRLSMLDAALTFLYPDGFNNEMFLPDEEAGPLELTPRVDSYKPYLTQDGAVTLMIVSDKDFAGTCRAAGRDDLIQDERFSDTGARRQNSKQLRAVMEATLAKWPTDELLDRMAQEEAPCARVNTRDDVLRDPQVAHNRSLVELRHPTAGRMKVARAAAIFDEEPFDHQLVAPRFGEHSEELLAELGLGADELDRLRSEGVIL